MSSERRLRILVEFGSGDVTAAGLCEVSRRILGVTGAGIMLFTNEHPLGSACTTSAIADVVEDLQHALGEGPCVDAYRHDRPVLEPDLANPAAPRWPAFTGPALEAGVRAIFGFPVGVGSARLGALNLCVDRPGALTDDQHADALVMATVAAESLLATQAGLPPGALATELEANSNLHYAGGRSDESSSRFLTRSVARCPAPLRRPCRPRCDAWLTQGPSPPHHCGGGHQVFAPGKPLCVIDAHCVGAHSPPQHRNCHPGRPGKQERVPP